EGPNEGLPEAAPLSVFGGPNSAQRGVDYATEIRKLSSLIIRHDLDAPLDGLDSIDASLHPPVGIVFWSFRIMVGLGLAMLALGAWSLLARLRRRLHEWPALHRAALLMAPAGFVAVIAGWATTEV